MQEARAEVESIDLAPYEEALQRALEQLQARTHRLPELRKAAKAQREELLAIPGPGRRLKVQRARTRFRNPFLVERLIEDSRRLLAHDPEEAKELAELAYEVALRVPAALLGQARTMTIVARATAARGNVLRSLGCYRDAEPLLEVAYALHDSDGDSDPLATAELQRLLASLRIEQRRFEQAETLLEQVTQVYEECAERRQLAKAWILKAIMLDLAGRPEDAISSLDSAAATIEPDPDADLHYAVTHNRVIYLIHADRFRDAQAVIEVNRELFESCPDKRTQLRHQRNRGVIAHGLGDFEEAERALSQVRASLLQASLHFDAAMVGLDLALVYLDLRKHRELRQLAETIVPIFTVQDIQREALASMTLLLEASRREAVSTGMVRELMRFMERVRQPVVPSTPCTS